MADDADMRAVLREHGHEPSQRGKLSPRWVAEYERITSGGNGSEDPGADDDWDGPDDSADLIDMEPVTAIIPGTEPDDMPPPEAERRPRRVSTRKPSPGGSFLDRLAGKKPATGKGKVKRKVQARVPVDRFIGRMWTTAARLFAPVSQPTARAFALEAPVAGLIFEDLVSGTIVDRVLQPAVRAEKRAEQVIALTPPLLVLGIERAQGLDEPRRSMQLAVLFSMLEEALTLQVQFAGERMAEAQERMAADEQTRAQVAALIQQIFPPADVQAQPEPGPEFDFGMAGAGERTG